MKKVDLIIPLQDGGSEHGDAELKYLLRSLWAYAKGIGRILIVTGKRPAWLNDSNTVIWIPCSDIYKHNKDGNLFRKVRRGLEHAVKKEVVWTCDDCALLEPCDLSTLPVSHSTNGSNDPLWKIKSNWHDRMRRTFGYVHGRTGKWLPVEYDSHLPQRLNRKLAIEAIEACRDRWAVDYGGLNINTAIVPFSMPADAEETVPWGKLKTTFEKGGKIDSLGDKTWVSYNDAGWDCGVARLLAERFPVPSPYERS
jgi:hypothetical protein